MPAGYSSKCKSCNSPYRLQIEAWHKEGKSSEAIEVLLQEKYEIKISCTAIRNHLNEHYDVAKEVQQQYNQSQANLQKDAGERVSEIIILDGVIAGKADLHTRLEKIFTTRIKGLDDVEEIGELPKLPMAYVSLYTACAAGICQALKAKQELLGEDSGKKKADAMQSWVDLMLEDEAR